jgi:hypothetical protein
VDDPSGLASNAWQIYSSDYDTHAAYYGIAKAAEPLHVQINLPGNAVVVINTTRDNAPGLTATTRILGLDDKELFARRDRLDALANRDTLLPAVPLGALLAQHPMVLVSQSLSDRSGHVRPPTSIGAARMKAAIARSMTCQPWP